MATARILVVDDEPTTLRLVYRALEDKYEVISASSPRRALEIAISKPGIDLVISDLEMTEMRGSLLLEEIYQISPTTAGLLISGKDEALPELPRGTQFLTKPFSSNELLTAVERVLVDSQKLKADLTTKMEKTTALLEYSQRLKSDLSETISRSSEICHNSREIHNAAPPQNNLKQSTGTIICAFCTAELPISATLCNQCNKPVGLQVIVRDGAYFGVAVKGEIKLHGLQLKHAQELTKLLNEIEN